jgi:hypothetical protein
MPTADSYERMANKLVALQQKRQPRPTPKPVASKPNPLEDMVNNYVRTAPAVAQSQAENNFFNPVPSITRAVGQGRRPTKAEWGTDGAFLAAGAIPFGKIGTTAARLGGRGGPKAIETLSTQNKRTQALQELLDEQGPRAVHEYLNFPLTAYSNYINKPLLAKYFKETSEYIPRGQQMYRALTPDEVGTSNFLSLPRKVGDWWRPEVIKSAAGSDDLQRLGQLADGMLDTGGGQRMGRSGFAQIEARGDIPGISNINEFLDNYTHLKPAYRVKNPVAGTSNFNSEAVIGPGTQYRLRDFRPQVGTSQVPPHWTFDAYRP